MTLQKARNLSSRLLGLAGRALLALVSVLLVVMPWTEYFCNFDKFLRGGQDVELGLLCVLTVLCLVLVLFQHGRNLVAFLISIRQCGAPTPRPAGPSAAGFLRNRLAALHAATLPSDVSGGFSLPLQI